MEIVINKKAKITLHLRHRNNPLHLTVIYYNNKVKHSHILGWMGLLIVTPINENVRIRLYIQSLILV